MGRAQKDPTAFDLRWAGAICSRNDEVEETGLGAGVLNDPVMGIVWLSERLEAYGQKIRAGDIVLSGSFIRPIEARPHDESFADCVPFGPVSIGFSSAPLSSSLRAGCPPSKKLCHGARAALEGREALRLVTLGEVNKIIGATPEKRVADVFFTEYITQ